MPITATAIILNMASEVARFSESRAARLTEGLFSQCAVGQQHSEHAKQNGKPAKYEHYLILMRANYNAHPECRLNSEFRANNCGSASSGGKINPRFLSPQRGEVPTF
jgi:hypothetical protein